MSASEPSEVEPFRVRAEVGSATDMYDTTSCIAIIERI